MSQENVDLAHAAARCFNEEDWDGLASLIAPDGVMTPVENWPEPGPFRGREAIVQQLQRLISGFEQSHVTIEGATDRGDWVITRYRWVVRATGSEIPIEARLTSVQRIEDGVSAELHFRFDHDAALEAAGLRE
jgi:ketosteroid isomerase-like protein